MRQVATQDKGTYGLISNVNIVGCQLSLPVASKTLWLKLLFEVCFISGQTDNELCALLTHTVTRKCNVYGKK